MTDSILLDTAEQPIIDVKKQQQQLTDLSTKQQQWQLLQLDSQHGFVSDGFHEGYKHCARDALSYLSSRLSDSNDLPDLRRHLLNNVLENERISMSRHQQQSWPWPSHEMMIQNMTFAVDPCHSYEPSVTLNESQGYSCSVIPSNRTTSSTVGCIDTMIDNRPICNLNISDTIDPVPVSISEIMNNNHRESANVLNDITEPELIQNALLLDRLASTNPSVEKLLQELFSLMDEGEEEEDSDLSCLEEDDTDLSSSYDDEGIDIMYNSMEVGDSTEIHAYQTCFSE